jgi:hypothetical protein
VRFETFSLAIRLWSVGPDEGVGCGPERSGEHRGAITAAVITKHSLDVDALVGEEALGTEPEGRSRFPLLVGEDL